MKRVLFTSALAAAAIASLTTVAPEAGAVQANGQGWTAAIQHQTGPQDDQGRLVMVRPEGGIVPIGEVSDDARIVDVSADGKRVLTVRDQDGETRVSSWDVTTKNASYFRIPESSGRLSFGAGGIVQTPREKGDDTVVVRGYDGATKHRYAASALNSGRDYRSSVVSPDGKYLIEAADRIVVRDAATGSVVKTLAQPEQQGTERQCDIKRAWGNAAVGVSCQYTYALDTQNLYRVPFDGTASRMGEVLSEVWPVSGGFAYDAGGPNGPVAWTLKNDAGEHDLPLGDRSDVVGSNGARVFVTSSAQEPSNGSTLFTHDVDTGKRVTLAGTDATGGGVITDAQTVDGNQ